MTKGARGRGTRPSHPRSLVRPAFARRVKIREPPDLTRHAYFRGVSMGEADRDRHEKKR